MNIPGGVKYAFVQDRERNFIVSGALRFEFDSGSTDVFQGQGDGIVISSIAADWGTGGLLDGGDNNEQIFWHAYADYNVTDHFTAGTSSRGSRCAMRCVPWSAR